jgi:ParB/RepB/Spo0J family partition protein
MSPTAAERPRAADPEPNGLAPKNGAPKTPKEAWQVVLLPVDAIAPCPYQPRLLFDPAEMADLAESVKQHGVQQPILVRPSKPDAKAPEKDGSKSNGKPAVPLPYELVAGERRLRASKDAGRKHIPAIVRELDDRTAAEIALTENVQRSNLSVIEEARGYRQLMLKFRMSEGRIAKKVGKSVATIRETMKLLALPEPLQQLLATRKLTASHGHALLPLAAHERVCLSVAQHAVTTNVTASSLSQNPLPNARELANKKLVQELDWRSKFDWRTECESCPLKAFVKSGYASYCLIPSEWGKKQLAAVERMKGEEAQAMQRVKDVVAEQQESGQVDVTRLPSGSYRDLTRVELPAGCCEACPCRKQVPDPQDGTKTVPVCLDPERFKKLREDERKAHEEKRRRHYTLLWSQAVAVVQSEVEAEGLKKMPVLLAALVLRSELHRYGAGGEVEQLPRLVARELGIALPWDELLGARTEADLLAVLQSALAAEDGTDGERETLSTGQVLYAPDPYRLMLFASALLLASEAQHAVRWAESTPRLDFVLGPQAQGELNVDGTVSAPSERPPCESDGHEDEPTDDGPGTGLSADGRDENG